LLRVALLNDYEIVVAGLSAMLAPFSDRVTLLAPPAGARPSEPVDVTLVDAFGRADDAVDVVKSLAAEPEVGYVVVFTFGTERELVDAVLAAGARGVVTKSRSADELVADLERVAAGEVVVTTGAPGRPSEPRSWPGRRWGLTEREAEVLAHLIEGRRNLEIASALGVSANTVKSHLRAVFRKLGVETRAHSVALAVAEGTFVRGDGRDGSRHRRQAVGQDDDGGHAPRAPDRQYSAYGRRRTG